ncbi:MAG: tRNA glutamyl-Q(34) synthetase GluQRS [Rhodothermales bacterium]
MTDTGTRRNEAAKAPIARGRYAPSPTGRIHLGNARTALAAWLSVRRQQGVFVWRLEDLDAARTVPGLAEAAVEDLQWLGIDWDEGPGAGGAFGPYVQSTRTDRYDAALRRLHQAGRLFPCARSRKDLEALSSAPHGAETAPYPAALRPADVPPGWFEALMAAPAPEASIRFRVEDGEVELEDRVYGTLRERVSEAVGDFVLRRRDGYYAYQLAVVVDDLQMGITEVVRGADLLWSTPRQIQLIEALGGVRPAYGHVPLVLNAEGQKLSKRDAGLALGALHDAGIRPEQVVGYLAHSLGLLPAPRPIAPPELIPLFDWGRIGREDWVLPADPAKAIAGV